MDSTTLLLDQSDHILTLTLNQPATLNSLDLPQWDELAHVLSRASDDADIHAIVLTGAGRAFSAGADIRGMRERRTAAQQIARLNQINPVIQQLAAETLVQGECVETTEFQAAVAAVMERRPNP